MYTLVLHMHTVVLSVSSPIQLVYLRVVDTYMYFKLVNWINSHLIDELSRAH